MGDEVKKHGLWVEWCSEMGQWVAKHDSASCQAPQHTMICVTPDDVCVLLNAMSQAYQEAFAGSPWICDRLSEAFESVTSESIDTH